MIKIQPQTLKPLRNAIYNKNNSVVNLLIKRNEGVTELSKMFLGKTQQERRDVLNLLKNSLPNGCGEIFCTFS